MHACRYGSPQVRHAICSIVLQKVMCMAVICKDVQQEAYMYAQKKFQEIQGSTMDIDNQALMP